MRHAIPIATGFSLALAAAFFWWQAYFPARWYRLPRELTFGLAWATGVLGVIILTPFYQMSD